MDTDHTGSTPVAHADEGPPGKRRAVNGSSSASSGEDIAELFASTKADILQQTAVLIATSMDNTQGKIQNYIDRKVQSLDDKTDARFTRTECDIALIRESQERLRTQHDSMWESLKTIQDTLAIAEPVVKQYNQQLQGDDRDYYSYDASVVRINSQNDVDIRSLQDLVNDLLGEVGIPLADATLHGAGLGNRFTLDFKANPDQATAVRRVNKFITNLKEGKKWREFFLQRPDDEQEKIFIGRDKPLCQLVLDQHIKLLHKALADTVDNEKTYTYNKGARKVSRGWDCLAKIVFDDATKSSKIEWVRKIVTKHRIDCAAIERTYRAMVEANDKQRRG